MFCGPRSGIASGSSGESLARRSDSFTVLRRAASLKSFVTTVAFFGPKELVTATFASATLPAVETWFAAKRMLLVSELPTFTLIASALDIFTTRSISACDASREMMSPSSRPASGINRFGVLMLSFRY